jgi:hypothetical protein
MQMTLWGKFSRKVLDHRLRLIRYDSVIENGPWLWQSNSFYTNYSDFFIFCDFIEVSIP